MTPDDVKAWSRALIEQHMLENPAFAARCERETAERRREIERSFMVCWLESWHRAPMDRYLAQLGDA